MWPFLIWMWLFLIWTSLFFNLKVKRCRWCPNGESISPTPANIVLHHHEDNWINNSSPEFKPLFYRRYIYDTFVLFNKPSWIQPFLQYFNKQHSRMKFTLESERNNSIAFFDIIIVKHNDSFATNLYRKPTFMGLGCKYNSAISEVYRTGLITFLIDRPCQISSTYQIFALNWNS